MRRKSALRHDVEVIFEALLTDQLEAPPVEEMVEALRERHPGVGKKRVLETIHSVKLLRAVELLRKYKRDKWGIQE